MGCAGCKSLLGGKTRQKHSDLRRARMAEAMAGSRKVEEAKERKRKFVEEALKAEEEKRAKVTGDASQAKRKIKDQDHPKHAKKTRMEEIEAEAIQTDDIEELGKLYTEYM